MVGKRTKKASTFTPNKKARTSKALKARATHQKPNHVALPNEMLMKIFHNLDVITATCWSLAYKNFRSIYLDLAPKVFGKKWALPRRLKTSYTSADGAEHFTLFSRLSKWMPEHLKYDPFCAAFIEPEALKRRIELIEYEAEDEEERKEQEWIERYEKPRVDKEKRQLERRERNKWKKQLRADRHQLHMKQKGNESRSESGLEEEVDDGEDEDEDEEELEEDDEEKEEEEEYDSAEENYDLSSIKDSESGVEIEREPESDWDPEWTG